MKIAGAVAWLWLTPAGAEPPGRAYAHDSTTLLLSTDLSPLPTVGGRIEFDAAVRAHRRGGFAGEARLGVAYAFSTLAGSDLFGVRLGGAAGYSIPIACRVVLTPMAAYDLIVFRETGGATALILQRATVELPISIVLYPHVVLEPYMQVGVEYSAGGRELVVVAGPRLGLVF